MRIQLAQLRSKLGTMMEKEGQEAVIGLPSVAAVSIQMFNHNRSEAPLLRFQFKRLVHNLLSLFQGAGTCAITTKQKLLCHMSANIDLNLDIISHGLLVELRTVIALSGNKLDISRRSVYTELNSMRLRNYV